MEEKGALNFPECTGCDTNKLPGLTINLNNKEFSLPGESLLNDDCKLMLAPSDMDTSASTTAAGSFFGDSGSKNWLLGASFLKNYYSIYDLKESKVGLI